MGQLTNTTRTLVSTVCAYAGRDNSNKHLEDPQRDKLACDFIAKVRKLAIAAAVMMMKQAQADIEIEDLFQSGLITEDQRHGTEEIENGKSLCVCLVFFSAHWFFFPFIPFIFALQLSLIKSGSAALTPVMNFLFPNM